LTAQISSERLSSLFRPRSVALVGASDKSPFSQRTFENLTSFGYGDRLFLINRRGAETHGRPSVTSCQEIGEPVDVAFMMVPQAGTLDALSDAAAAGIRNAVVLSSGYGEAGPAGRAAEDELVAHAASLGMLVLGPNMLGFANLVDGIPITSIPGLPREAGPVALLSQSGAASAAMVDFANLAGVGLSYMVTLGNEAMITAGDILNFLVDDDVTRAIAMFIETIRDPEAFRSAARRAAAAGKAVVVLKAGSSELSARTAAAHTGALVGDDRTIDAVFRDLGIIRVDTIEDMLITAGVAAHTGPLTTSGIGVVSISGGACDIIADRAEDVGGQLPPFAPETVTALEAVMPEYGTIHNPLDVTGAAVIKPALFSEAIAAVSADPSVGVLAVVAALPWQEWQRPFGAQPLLNGIGIGLALSDVPAIVVNQVMQPMTARTLESLAEASIPYAVCGLAQSVTALSRIAAWSETIRTASPDAPGGTVLGALTAPAERTGSWSEQRARELLSAAGIPVVPGRVVDNAEEAVAIAASFGGPAALKLVSPDVLHKSDIGGVRLNVAGAADVRAAFEAVHSAGVAVAGARLEGVLVAPMRSGGTELLVGVVHDPQWGPMLAIAIGGIFVEVLQDSALAPLPVTPAKAATMIRGLRGAGLLTGVRGGRAADIERIAGVVSRIGDLALALGEDLESLEVNPLWVNGGEVEALDAVVTWRDEQSPTSASKFTAAEGTH
jgi:acyl-CoA synthetase (NDP forming)